MLFWHEVELYLPLRYLLVSILRAHLLFQTRNTRLTFWLSNSVVLRAIVTRAFAEHQLPFSAGHFPERPVGEKGNRKKLSPLKWKESSPNNKTKGTLCGSFDDWDDPRRFASALEKIESLSPSDGRSYHVYTIPLLICNFY